MKVYTPNPVAALYGNTQQGVSSSYDTKHPRRYR